MWGSSLVESVEYGGVLYVATGINVKEDGAHWNPTAASLGGTVKCSIPCAARIVNLAFCF